jgi:lipopolysaccharide transport system permease protein
MDTYNPKPRFSIDNLSPESPVLICLFNFLMLVGGMMVAVWLRYYFPFGKTLGAEYEPWPLILTLILITAAVGTYIILYITAQVPSLARFISPQQQFRVLIVATFLACVLIYFLLPEVSQLQFAYFAPMTIAVGVLTIVLPGRLRDSAYVKVTIIQNIKDLFKNSSLIATWLRYRIAARYSQTFLGILWIVLLPLATSAVLAFAFTQLLGRADGFGVPLICFILSGQVIFDIFRSSVQKSLTTIMSNIGVIKQVYFPREIIIILNLGEIVVDFFFTFIVLMVINALYGIYPNIYYIYLPIPIFLMLVLSTGLAFIVSWISLLIRDMKQLIGVLLQLLYFTVVFYSPERATSEYEFIMSANPLAAIAVAFRDIILYARPPDLQELFVPIVLSVALLYYGYVFFKVNEDRFVDLQ